MGIPVAWRTDETALAAAGVGAWPVRGADEYAALAAIARTMGAELDETGAVPPPAAGLGGSVVALGAQVEAEARLYAALTGRACRVVAQASALAALDDVAVVVAPEERLEFPLLAELYAAGRPGPAPGLVYAESAALLRRQVLVRSAAARLCLPAAPHRIDVFAERPFPRTDLGDWILAGSPTSPTEMRALLGAGAGLLRVLTHSDGVDAFLGPQLALCPLVPEPENAPAGEPPLCRLIGDCYRTGQPVDEAHRRGYTLPAAAIAARVLLWDVCWGLRPPPDVNHAGWGYTRPLLRAARVGALLTTWEIVRVEPSISAPLADAIAAGVPLGHALAAHLRDERRAQDGHRMCLVGDPALRLPARLDCASSALVMPPPDRAPRADVLSALGFLRAYAHAARAGHQRVFEDRTGPLLAALDAFERGFHGGGVREPDASALREAVFGFVGARWGVAVSTWSSWVQEARYDGTAGTCWACGRATRSFVATLSLAGRPRRAVTECPNCGCVADLPVGRTARFERGANGVLRVDAIDPGAAVQVMLHNHRLGPVLRWPRTGAGLAPVLRLPLPWDSGPLRLAIFVVWPDFGLGVLGFFARGEALANGRAGSG